ncbi:MAG TPA: calcium-binding protein, partial [Sphingomicrobium sp.]|nr:calcium-binding protein [Sphingomicrobium sp.]
MAIINGTPASDTLVGTPDSDTITGFAGNDVIRGRGGDDTIDGGDDHDHIVGGDGNDVILGGNGDDYIRGGEGDDVVDGGAGWDRAAFTVLTNNPAIGETGVQTGATVDLNIQGVAQNTGHGWDTLIGIEHASGTAYDDVLTGNGGDNWIWGEGGNDTLSGGGGNDLVETDAGNSVLDGGLGNDTAGFQGIDTFTSGVTVSLALQGAAQSVAAGSSITLSNFENLTGTTHDDTLSGDGNDNILAGNLGNDTLAGGAGNDTLYGDGAILPDTHGTGYSGPITTLADASAVYAGVPGNDTLDGGAGDDIMNGGGGTDTASFASATESVFVSLGLSGNGSASQESGEFDQLISI